MQYHDIVLQNGEMLTKGAMSLIPTFPNFEAADYKNPYLSVDTVDDQGTILFP